MILKGKDMKNFGLDEKVIEGLYNCSKDFPENGSELYVLAMVK